MPAAGHSGLYSRVSAWTSAFARSTVIGVVFKQGNLHCYFPLVLTEDWRPHLIMVSGEPTGIIIRDLDIALVQVISFKFNLSVISSESSLFTNWF